MNRSSAMRASSRAVEAGKVNPAPARKWLVAGLAVVVLGAGGWMVYAKVLNRDAPSAAKGVAAPAVEGGMACCNAPPDRYAAAPGDAPPGMVWIAGGEFAMGDSAGDGQPHERPVHPVRVDGFFIDTHEVTNAQFRAFVDATGYKTTAERVPDLREIMKQLPPGSPPPDTDKLKAGSLVFQKPAGPVQLGFHGDWAQWWAFVSGADWRHPEGPASDLTGRDRHPVVQVSWDDAVAYCQWAGRRLPTEAEWEFAARGGIDRARFIWGNAEPDAFKPQANIWQGTFPSDNTVADGYAATAPVGQFPPNGYGLYDMAGNVWEWCGDWYRQDTYDTALRNGVQTNPQGPDRSLDPNEPLMPKRTIRGGSFLCTDQYCSSYRPSARMRTSPDSATNHQGFRAVMTREQWETLKGKMGK